jgi:pSer/pThr/pTyr-binding forkhead associated (FHA) protein
MDSGQIIPLENRTEFTLGRSAEGQPILPDIDLAPYRGYEHGVSRLHASIVLSGQDVLATDLGSANGSRLNGVKIPPHKPNPVKHGDILTLGKLKIQLLIRR